MTGIPRGAKLFIMSKPSAPARSSSSVKKTSKAPSASKKADQEARKGRPLTAKSQKERSPKQENL
ncbi:MAG: hypothetical protein K0R17_1679 [Rariglobus sp.]|jgi:hypothetical protein|nr:hypothetical protein [Rariglobus sp.]